MNQEAEKLIAQDVKKRDLGLSTEQIQHRMMSRFVNEAALCLQEGVIEGAVDGDMGAVFGVGFLPHYGGPFRMLDIVGVGAYVERMRAMAGEYGEHFEPCQLLRDHAKANKSSTEGTRERGAFLPPCSRARAFPSHRPCPPPPLPLCVRAGAPASHAPGASRHPRPRPHHPPSHAEHTERRRRGGLGQKKTRGFR